MTEKDLIILKQMLVLSNKLNKEFITFHLLTEELENRIKLVEDYLNN